MYCIYMHKNKINGKVYIGQTCQKPEYRWQNGNGYKRCPLFYRAIQKYTWENFDHIILEEDILTQDEADEKEKYWINYYNSNNKNYGYNLTSGGADFLKEKWKESEYREYMHKQLSKIQKEKYKNEDYKQKRVAACQAGIKNFWNDPVKRQKHIESISGDNSAHNKPVKNIETGMIFNSMQLAIKYFNIKSSGQLTDCCQGKKKSCGKHPETGEPLHWVYVNKETNEPEQIPPDRFVNKGYHKVICLNTGQVFSTATEAARWCGLKTCKSVMECCKHKMKSGGRHPITGEKLVWAFYEEEVE